MLSNEVPSQGGELPMPYSWASEMFTCQVDNLGGLMAVAVANARAIEGGRGALGIVNWVSARLLAMAHRR